MGQEPGVCKSMLSVLLRHNFIDYQPKNSSHEEQIIWLPESRHCDEDEDDERIQSDEFNKACFEHEDGSRGVRRKQEGYIRRQSRKLR